jgi:hypothetical protein
VLEDPGGPPAAERLHDQDVELVRHSQPSIGPKPPVLHRDTP